MNEAATQQAAVCRWLDKCEETRTINAPVMVAMLRLAVRSGALSVPTLRYIAKGLGATAVELEDARDERGTRSVQRLGRLLARWRERADRLQRMAMEYEEEDDDEELAFAAMAYLDFHTGCSRNVAIGNWPWEEEGFKPSKADPIRNLVKAGALIAAEIDRLERKRRKAPTDGSEPRRERE